jgi:uncharacterized protein with ParB-like and HNH nuclease domain
MKTENNSISEVLEKNNTAFFIPPFQRAYAWGKTEIERFYSDIITIINSELDENQIDKQEHFFGTLVIKTETEGFSSKSIVVDGQQRLTTTLLFLIAIRNLENDDKIRNLINSMYLINNGTNQDKIKLKQVTRDWNSFKSLVENTNVDEYKKSTIIQAYDFFRNLISQHPQITTDLYLKALRRLNVAIIFLDERPCKGEDPQIIFETLNSLGKPLTLADLIRNYILLNMKSDQQSSTYEKIWYPQIESVLEDSTSAFFRDYLQMKRASTIKVADDANTKEIYYQFKDFVKTSFVDHDLFIKDITSYVKWYICIITEENKRIDCFDEAHDKEIKELLRNIFHDIKAEAFKPLVLGLLSFYGESVQPNKSENLISILQVIRTYLIRRRVLGLSNGENKNIVLLCNQISSIFDEGENKMLFLLSKMFYKMRLPNDKELLRSLSELDFYNGLKKYSKFILGKMEEENAKVSVDFRNPSITIEHIMPQKLSKEWEDELGPNFQDIHDNYLHKIGNLILTEFNSEIGNKSFAEKKDKYETSSLSYRLSIINKAMWNEESILNHQKEMIECFLKTFPLPEVYRSTNNWNEENGMESEDGMSIFPGESEDDDCTGRKPKMIRIKTDSFKVDSWQDVFLKFVSYVKGNYDFEFVWTKMNESSLKNPIFIKWCDLSKAIKDEESLKKRYKTLDGYFCYESKVNINSNTLLVHTNASSVTFIKDIKKIMDILGIESESVEIFL